MSEKNDAAAQRENRSFMEAAAMRVILIVMVAGASYIFCFKRHPNLDVANLFSCQKSCPAYLACMGSADIEASCAAIIVSVHL